jgi:hypothetical protein
MRWLLIITCLVLHLAAGAQNNQQNNQWVINTSQLGATFQTPTVPTLYTADSVKDNPDSVVIPAFAYYNCAIDSGISLQVHIIDSAFIDLSDELIDSIFIANNSDTLRTLAAMMVAAVPCNLTQLITVSSPVDGIEIGLETTYDSTNPEYMFCRYFVRNNRFFAFTITGGANDLIRMMGYKNDFYNSIVINY